MEIESAPTEKRYEKLDGERRGVLVLPSGGFRKAIGHTSRENNARNSIRHHGVGKHQCQGGSSESASAGQAALL